VPCAEFEKHMHTQQSTQVLACSAIGITLHPCAAAGSHNEAKPGTQRQPHVCTPSHVQTDAQNTVAHVLHTWTLSEPCKHISTKTTPHTHHTRMHMYRQRVRVRIFISRHLLCLRGALPAKMYAKLVRFCTNVHTTVRRSNPKNVRTRTCTLNENTQAHTNKHRQAQTLG
jgi:hypothetical protein